MKKNLDLGVRSYRTLNKLIMTLKMTILIIVFSISNVMAGALENSIIANTSKSELQQKVVTGKITDTKGAVLPGVNISLKGTLIGTIADMEGKYSIPVPEGNPTLVFSFIGFTSQEIAVSGNNTIDVKLSEELTVLNEVVVTALGIKKEAKRIGYSTATVNNENITTNRTINVGNSLEGKVAGLNISAPAGGPGGSSKIRIRGQSSLQLFLQSSFTLNIAAQT